MTSKCLSVVLMFSLTGLIGLDTCLERLKPHSESVHEMNLKLMLTLLLSLGLCACGVPSDESLDGSKTPPSEEVQARTCSDACVKMSACSGATQQQCEGKCGMLSHAQLKCIAGTTTCSAAETCLSSDSDDDDPDDTTPDNTDTSSGDCSGPLGACKADEICVQKSGVYSCVKTNLQSCNEKVFPDICDCLYPAYGEVPPEAKALCSAQGISNCSIISNRLSVACK